MCKFASIVQTKDRDYWSKNTDLIEERNYWMKRAGMMAVCAVIGWAAFTAMICWAMGRAP